MIDEKDTTQERAWFNEALAKTVVTNLQKNNIQAQYVANGKTALSTVLDMIPPGAFIGRGDSITIDQIGIIPELVRRKHRVLDPLERNADGQLKFPDREQRKKILREVFSADVYLVGTNAVTLDGKLVNIDGWGNRVAPMIAGPDKVIVVVGINKVTKDVDDALERVRNYAAPMNSKRHLLKHERPEFADLPCVRTGRCLDCRHKWRICRKVVIIEGSNITEKDRINVVLVGEELGI